MIVYGQFNNSNEYIGREIENVTLQKILREFKVNLKNQTLMYRIRMQNDDIFVKLSLKKKDIIFFEKNIKNELTLWIKVTDTPVVIKDDIRREVSGLAQFQAIILCLLCLVLALFAPKIGMILSPAILILFFLTWIMWILTKK